MLVPEPALVVEPVLVAAQAAAKVEVAVEPELVGRRHHRKAHLTLLD
jgi:hypothetical protein